MKSAWASVRHRLSMARPGPLILAAVGIALLTGMDGIVKELAHRYDTLQLTFLRFFAAGLVIAAMIPFGRPVRPSARAAAANVVRGILIGVSTLGFFHGLGRLPIADVLALSYLAPLIVAVLSIPLLGEQPSRKVFGGLVLGLGGVFVTIGGIGQGDTGREQIIGIAAVLLAATTYAVSIILLRRQAQRDPAVTVAFFQSVVPAFILAGPALVVWVPVTPPDAMLFAVVGILGAAGFLLLSKAFAAGLASRLVVVEYTGFFWAALIGLVFFGEALSTATLIGAVLVIGACLIVRR